MCVCVYEIVFLSIRTILYAFQSLNKRMKRTQLQIDRTLSLENVIEVQTRDDR